MGKQFINASDYSKLQAYERISLKELIAADKNNQADSKETTITTTRLREVDYEEYR